MPSAQEGSPEGWRIEKLAAQVTAHASQGFRADRETDRKTRARGGALQAGVFWAALRRFAMPSALILSQEEVGNALGNRELAAGLGADQ